MHTRLQKDYRKMKKISATILASAMTLALFAGCGQKISETDVSVTSSETQATATAATTAETSAQATEETFEDVSFEDYRGTQLLNYLDHQYYFDGEPRLRPISSSSLPLRICAMMRTWATMS